MEAKTIRKPKHCSYCRKEGHNIITCPTRKMDEKTPQYDEGKDYSSLDDGSDEYIHNQWSDNEDISSSSCYKESSDGVYFSMGFDSEGSNDDEQMDDHM
ncbi:hypothetical protein PIB30_046669 [Stylosanthes scabra]|uniref:Transcription factor interactor and regulator CCHC(Zn) family n=1 Tax=Stylosanthes scabra TaxID=79078 RepID=A0ABU6SH81_9FABA|nr:hypothetical protein [Stylosanthes scabra]